MLSAKRYVTDAAQLNIEWSHRNMADPSQVTLGSNKSLGGCAVCACEYLKKPCRRKEKKDGKISGCPRCGCGVATPFNNLAARYLDLALEWSYQDNDKSPHEVTYGSQYEAVRECLDCKEKFTATCARRIRKIKRGDICQVV